MTRSDWLEPELPGHAADLADRMKARLLARARLDLLQRTFTGTFVYPILTLLIAWIVGLTDDHPRAVVFVAAAFSVVVGVRVILYRRAIVDTSRPTFAARAHLLLGIVTGAAFASAIGCAYLARDADATVTAGYLAVPGIAGSVVMIASTHRRLAIVWVLASMLPALVVFVIHGSATARVMLTLYVLYLPILRKMIDKGHEAYWDAQVNAARLDEHAHEFARLSRLAGMAENATNVLHDVGNALNGVKTSTACLRSSLEAHPASDLGRLVQLLGPHADDLRRFFATDPRATKIFPFIEAVASTGATHLETTAAELARIDARVEHIETIVRRQQDIAQCVGRMEPCRVVDLVGDALGLARHAGAFVDADLQRTIDPDLEVVADRHRTLQILVNLLDNACEATAEGVAAPRIHARAVVEGTQCVVVEITDNGCGIAPDVAERVFTRGFTTKPHGHGFGLHGSFALAQAMGGSLSFASDGPGRGATFRLRLPRPAAAAA